MLKTAKLLSIVLLGLVIGMIFANPVEAGYIDDGTWLEIEPEGNWDELEYMDSNMTTTYDSWAYKPSGRFIGGVLEESVQKINIRTEANDIVTVVQELYFSHQDIASGMGEAWVRLPLDSRGFWEGGFYIIEVDEDAKYFFNQQGEIGFENPDQNDSKANCIYNDRFNVNNTGINDGDYKFTRKNRTYMKVVAPIKPDTKYLFVQYAIYKADTTVNYYVSPTFPGESQTFGYVNIYDSGDDDNIFSMVTNWTLGFSFIFMEGFSDGIKGHHVELQEYFTFRFFADVEGITGPEVDDYMRIQIPFISESELDFRVQVIENCDPMVVHTEYVNDARNLIDVTTDEFTQLNASELDSAFLDIMVQVRLLNYTEGDELILMLYDDSKTRYNYFGLPEDDTNDMQYYPDYVTRPYGAVSVYDNITDISPEQFGFSIVNSIYMVDENGTYINHEPSQITKGPPNSEPVPAWSPLQYNIIGEGEGAFHESKVFRGVHGYVEWYNDNNERLELLMPWVVADDAATEQLDFYLDEYEKNAKFRAGANYIMGNPGKAAFMLLSEGDDGLIDLANNEYSWKQIWNKTGGDLGLPLPDLDPPEDPMDRLVTTLENAIESVEDAVEWVKSTYVKIKEWIENKIEEIQWYIESILAIVHLSCTICCDVPQFALILGGYYATKLLIRIIVAPMQTVHDTMAFFGKAAKFFLKSLWGR